MKKEKHITTIRIDEDLMKLIDKGTEEYRISRSAYINLVLARALEKEERKRKRNSRQK